MNGYFTFKQCTALLRKPHYLFYQQIYFLHGLGQVPLDGRSQLPELHTVQRARRRIHL